MRGRRLETLPVNALPRRRDPSDVRAGHRSRPAPARPRLLAAATAVAALLSGLNALLQIAKVIVELGRKHTC